MESGRGGMQQRGPFRARPRSRIGCPITARQRAAWEAANSIPQQRETVEEVGGESPELERQQVFGQMFGGEGTSYESSSTVRIVVRGGMRYHSVSTTTTSVQPVADMIHEARGNDLEASNANSLISQMQDGSSAAADLEPRAGTSNMELSTLAVGVQRELGQAGPSTSLVSRESYALFPGTPTRGWPYDDSFPNRPSILGDMPTRRLSLRMTLELDAALEGGSFRLPTVQEDLGDAIIRDVPSPSRSIRSAADMMQATRGHAIVANLPNPFLEVAADMPHAAAEEASGEELLPLPVEVAPPPLVAETPPRGEPTFCRVRGAAVVKFKVPDHIFGCIMGPHGIIHKQIWSNSQVIDLYYEPRGPLMRTVEITGSRETVTIAWNDILDRVEGEVIRDARGYPHFDKRGRRDPTGSIHTILQLTVDGARFLATLGTGKLMNVERSTGARIILETENPLVVAPRRLHVYCRPEDLDNVLRELKNEMGGGNYFDPPF